VSVKAQETIDPLMEDYVEKKVMKCVNLFNLHFSGTGLKDLLRSNKYWDYECDPIKSSISAFGFSIPPEIVVTKYPKEYPDKNFTLYQVEIPIKSKINDSLYHRFGLGVGNYIVALNKNKEIKFVGGDFFKNHIVQDFKFKKKDPSSYLLFLELTYFDMQHYDFTYIKKEGSQFVYEGKSRDPRYLKFTIRMDPDFPEKSRREITYSEDKTTWFYPNKTSIKFKNKDEAQSFLTGEVMKNIYLYRLHTIPNVWDFLEPNSNYFKTNEAPIDHLIPDYDEKLLFGVKEHDRAPDSSFLVLEIKKNKSDLLERPNGYVLPPEYLDGDTIQRTLPFRRETFYDPYIKDEQYFLVFMNKYTNVIYYMSGEYFLSKVLNIDGNYNRYHSGQNYYQADLFPKQYVFDRLFRYRVKSRDAIRQVSETSDKIIFEAESGLESKKKLKIIFDKNVPEDLRVEEN